MTGSVVIITRDQDVTADLVCAELGAREVPVVRFDLADFPERLTQAAYLVDGRSHWTGALVGRHRDVDLENVRAVWYRKPSQFAFLEAMTATERQWAAAEAVNGFGGVLAALAGARWCNHPHRSAAAELKPAQMATAAACGLRVPDTLLTNDPDRARDFCAAHRDGVIYKPLRGGPASENGRHIALRATPVAAAQVTEQVRRTTHLFQARVPCAYAVRMTVVGRRLFAVRLDPPAGATEALDWRVHDTADLVYTPIEVPAAVADGVHRVMDSFGLRYAAPDFIVDHDGRWSFVGDLNPGGQWGWIAAHTGLPIAAALADELTAHEPAHESAGLPSADEPTQEHQ